MRKLAALQTEMKLDRVLITGDVTDAGTRAEWTAFMDLLRGCPLVQSRVSFVPGNHDVNIVDRTNPGRLDLPGSTGLSLRKLRVVLTLDSLQGDRAHIVDRKSGGLGPLLKDFLREDDRLERLRSLAERGTIRGRWEMTKVWNAIFPLVEPPSDESSYGLILLDSNAPSHIALTNAIGVVHPTQLKALRLILRNSPRSAWIILLHHQLVEYPIPRIPLRDRIGLALVNAPDVLATIAPHALRILVMHGHRHIDWIGTYGDLILCSAPSVSLGTEGKREPGSFHVYELSVASGGNIRLSASEQRYVA
jgi:3',5'-cyclic AMP phosphodiesterase CpdA